MNNNVLTLLKLGDEILWRWDGNTLVNKKNEKVLDIAKVLDTCKGTCCWRGPSISIENGERASEVEWPESVEDCAKRCEELTDCQAFYYYGEKDTEKPKACFLHKSGILSLYRNDGRDRYGGICTDGEER